MENLTLGFVGLGRMGGPMVRRLMAAGHNVTIFDARPDFASDFRDTNAAIGTSVQDVGASADIVFCSLPTPQIVHEVVLGDEGIASGGRCRTIIDVSTTGPSMAQQIAAGLKEKGIVWADAPVSGGIAGAQNGTLAVMLSCPEDARARVEPLLANFGKQFYCGDKPGVAQVVKLGNNMIAAGVILLSAEALAMGTKAGVDPQVMCDIINVSSGRNSATQDKFPKAVLPGTFDFGFATALSYKDVRMCVDEAENLGVPMVGGSLVRQMLAATKARFGPDADFTNMVRIIEEWAGVEIRS